MEWSELRLTVDGIDHLRGGEMAVYVFFKEGFPVKHEQALRHYRFEVSQFSHTLLIEVPDALFALKVHHDEGGSGSVTKDWTGSIPAEGLGFSSAARLGFGAPSFKDALMSKPESSETKLEVIYP